MAVLVAAVVVAVLGTGWLLSRPDAAGSGSAGSAGSSGAGSVGAVSGLPTVRVGDLPPEARQTLRLIASDGPFPYAQDSAVFSNREGLLPRESNGYYHEYTVVTPGSPDRGARRIIAGGGGETYYTADHYSSFREVVP